MDNSARHHHRNAQSVAAFLILLIAFAILVVFAVHKDEIIQPGTFQMFVSLAAGALALLAILLYFVGKEHKPAKTHKASRKVSSKKKRKK